MNPAAILSLIINLYEQLVAAQDRIKALEAEKAETLEAAPEKTTAKREKRWR